MYVYLRFLGPVNISGHWRPNEMMDDYDGQMIFLDLVGLKLPDICLTGKENPEKTSPRKLVPTGDRTRTRCVTSAHATACSTAVDCMRSNGYAIAEIKPPARVRFVFSYVNTFMQ